MSRFHPIDRQTGYLLPRSVDKWLPEDHLARFIVEVEVEVEVVDGLDVSALEKAYAGRGNAAYYPSVLFAASVWLQVPKKMLGGNGISEGVTKAHSLSLTSVG